MALLDSGYSLTCEDESTIGGVSRLYLINRESVVGFTADTDPDSHAYIAVSVDSTANTTSRFHQFEFLDNTLNATFENTLEDSGTNFVTSKIGGFIPRQEKLKASKLQKAIKSCKLIAIVQNNQGEAFVYGYDERLKKSAALRAAANGESGADLKDKNGYDFKLEGRGSDIPRQFVGSIVTTDGSTVTFS